MPNTSLKHAFARVYNKTPEDVSFEVDVARYLNNGGTIDRARAIIDAIAKKMSFRSDADGGHLVVVGNDHSRNASENSAGNGSAGQMVDVGNDHSAFARDNFRGNPEGGQNGCVGNDQALHASHLSGGNTGAGHYLDGTHYHVARKPIPASARAAALATRLNTASVLITYKVRDGRSIGSVRWYEIERLIRENSREASVLRLIKQSKKVCDDSATIGQIISAAQLETFIRQADQTKKALANV